MAYFLLRPFKASRFGTADRKSETCIANGVHQGAPEARRWHNGPFFLAASACCSLLLAGCGAAYVVRGAGGTSGGSGGSGGSSSTSTGSIAAAPSSVDFGTVSVGQSANSKVVLTNQGKEPVEVSKLSVSGQNFSVDGQGDLPITLAAGSTLSFKVHFKPQSDDTSTGDVTATTNSSVTPTATIKLHGNGKKTAASVSNGSLSCTNATMTGTGVDICTVTLAAVDAFDATNVNLSSSTIDVTLPATVTVPAGSMSASFTANVEAVSSDQTATLTALINGATATFAVKLDAYAPSLSMSASSIAFGNEAVNTTATKSITLTSSGAEPVTISSASTTGNGFSISGMAFPMTLEPGKTATVNVRFDPTAAGPDSGQLSIASNSSSNPTALISLSGSGTTNSPSTSSLNGITCSKGSITGSGSDACTVTLSSAAGSGGTSVNLSSSDAAVSVPGSVTVPANATSAAFTATVSAVTSAQTATLEADSAGVTEDFALQLGATTPTLSVSSTSISFGNITVGQTGTQSLTLTSIGNGPVSISAMSVAGSLFSASGLTVPATLNPGQSVTLTLHMLAQGANNYTGVLTIYSNSTTGNTVINMSGTGTSAPGTLSTLGCASGSVSAAGTVACTVSLSAPAGTGGVTVSLASNNSAVAVPSSVTVPANAASAGFNATVSSFSSQQTVTLTASSGGASQSFVLQLSTGSETLSINATSISFGSLVIGSPATQSVILTSTGTAAVTVNSASLSGTGFSISGVNFPVTLNPGQTATLSVQFDPTAAGAASGQLTITSTSSTNPVAVISLSGTGEPHEVNLTWNAPTGGTDPVAGYNVYRSPAGGTTYQQVGSTSASQTTYMDNTVASNQTYDYVVKSYDSSGNESTPSNMTSVTVP